MSSGQFGREAFTSLVTDSLFVGETENIGNPVTPEEKAYGRSLPKRLIPDFPIRGYQYYDYRVDVANTTFVNYQDNKQRGAGALSWLLFTSSGVTTENTIKAAKYVNAKPVYFPKIDTRFDNDNRGGVAYRTLAIHDLDGTTTGMGNSCILLNDGENDSVATDSTCKIQPTWNASICTGDVGRLSMAGGGGARAGGAGAPRAGGAGPGGPGGPARGCCRRSWCRCASRRRSWPGCGRWRCRRCCCPAAHRPQPQWQGLQDHGNQSTLRAGTEILVKTERPTVSFSLREMNQGLMGDLPAAGVQHRGNGNGANQPGCAARGNTTSYYKGDGSLWVKVVVPADPALPVRPTLSQISATAPDLAGSPVPNGQPVSPLLAN